MTRGRREDLSGRTFGNLTVLPHSHRDMARHVRWLCQCTCGRKVLKEARYLLNGSVRSCGFIHKWGTN